MAATGREAVIRTGATKYDAIILDLMLPDGNGFRVCRQLRQLGGDSPSSSSLPVTLPRT